MFNVKSVTIIILLIVLGVFLGKVSQNARFASSPNVFQKVALYVMTPFDITSTAIKSVPRKVNRFFMPRRRIVAQNRQLTKENEKLRRQLVAMRSTEKENNKLRDILDLRKNVDRTSVSAEIVSRTPANWFDTAVIDIGTDYGIKRGDCVVNDNGLIGQIFEANNNSSCIIYLTDSTSAVGAMIDRSRVAGILQGQGTDYLLLNYLHKDADVREGDTVISSGMGGVVPKGIIIGTVSEIKRDASAGTTLAKVVPSVKFDELEYVFVLKEKKP